MLIIKKIHHKPHNVMLNNVIIVHNNYLIHDTEYLSVYIQDISKLKLLCFITNITVVIL